MRRQATISLDHKKALFIVIFICILLSLQTFYPSCLGQFNARAEFGNILPILAQQKQETDETRKLCNNVKTLSGLYHSPRNQSNIVHELGGLRSQFYQDATLVSALGRFFDDNHPKLYVDAAAAWPERLSNTFVLDKCYSWRGLCIEADPSKASLLEAGRSCRVINQCVTDTEGQVVKFYTTTGNDTGSNGIHGLGTKTGETKEMTCTTMATIFDKHDAKHVDVMSLDVEGAEALALGGIDWSRVYIDMIVMEVDKHKTQKDGAALPDTAERIVSMLGGQGYVPVLGLFPKRDGLPILECSTVFYGQSVRSAFEVQGSLERWRRQDIIFVQNRSQYLQPMLDWIHAAGCSQT